MHWAEPLIGMPYRRGAAGPEVFDCWGLVRYVFATRYGVEMPAVAVDDPSADNVRAIREASRRSGWRPCDALLPAEGDIVLMHGIDGPHVGVMVEADGALLMLHAVQGAGVCAQTLAQVRGCGFSDLQLWRRRSDAAEAEQE